MVEEVMLPSVCDDENTEAWPGVVTADISHHLQRLKTSAAVVSGQIAGKTRLPLPATEGLKADRGALHAELHMYESAVIDWAHQILNVLKHDSAQPLIDGGHPIPLVELEFWSAKKKNLEFMSEQLASPEVDHMHEVLNEHVSSYAPTLARLKADVAAAKEECDDITLFLEPLRSYLEELEEVEFELLPIKFAQIMHVLSLIWRHSAHYATPRRFVVLLREIMNQVVANLSGFLGPRTLFGQEPDETGDKCTEALKVAESVFESYQKTRASIASTPPAENSTGNQLAWEFDNTLVLGRLESYVDRIRVFADVAKVRVDFEKLEKIELSNAGEHAKIIQCMTDFNDWCVTTCRVVCCALSLPFERSFAMCRLSFSPSLLPHTYVSLH
jgi:dynein heavy chain